jgi:hypothetical protein
LDVVFFEFVLTRKALPKHCKKFTICVGKRAMKIRQKENLTSPNCVAEQPN